jgi:PAS domain S-box-containing protein
MFGSESLDDIIRDNSNELQRRRSLPPAFAGPGGPDNDDTPMAMMDFSTTEGPFQEFQFGSIGSTAGNAMPGTFGNIGSDIGEDMHSSMVSETFAPPNMMAMSQGSFSELSQDMVGNMMAFSNLNMGQIQSDPAAAAALDLYSPTDLTSRFPGNPLAPVATDFTMAMEANPLTATTTSPTAAIGAKADGDMMAVENAFGAADGPGTTQGLQSMSIDPTISSYPQGVASLSQEASGSAKFPSTAATSQPVSQGDVPQAVPAAAGAVPAPGPGARVAKEKSVYSKSGFDMIRALWYVATRKNPEIQLGAVDMSCAFVVCDVTLNDCPIIYVSDNFQNLTGYSRHEIVGQNCRFLQAPDGKVEAGTKREFVENSAVYNLKRKIAEGKEVQQSLINYRKGGKPFLNLLTMIPIPWDTDDIRYFIGFQIDLVECPDAISGQETGGVQVNYVHSDIGQYIWTPPPSTQWDPENGQTLGVDDVSTLLQQYNPRGTMSEWHKQSWEKMLLENADDVVHVLSLKGNFLYASPSCRKILEYDMAELNGMSLSSICHPSDIVPVMRELKDATTGSIVNIVFRIRRKQSGYTWFESHGSLFVEQGKGRKFIILIGRKRPVFALHRKDLEANGGIGDSEIWTKLSTSGMFLHVSSNVRSLLDLLPENLEGTSMQDLMRKESRPEFGRTMEKARRGRVVSCKHEVQNKRGQVLQALTTLYPGDAAPGSKPTFLLAQTKLIKASSRAIAPATAANKAASTTGRVGSVSDDPTSPGGPHSTNTGSSNTMGASGMTSTAAGGALPLGSQEGALAADDNMFDELKTTRCTSWQYELRQMEKVNRLLAEELAQLLSNKKKRKRRKGGGNMVRDCANCHTRNTPEWRRGPSGNRDLCNSCGLRWAKQVR